MNGVWVMLSLVAGLYGPFAGAACAVKSPAEIAMGLDDVDRFIRSAMKEREIDAVSLAISHRGKVLFTAAFGNDVTPVSPFQAASISKPVAAFAAMTLVRKGLLALDRPMVGFVKEPFHPSEPDAGLITLRHLLNHTSGLPNDPDAEDRKIYSKPGSVYAYSGAGFFYAQKAVEDVTGRGFDAVTDDVLAALAMKRSSFR